jgi:phage-related protein
MIKGRGQGRCLFFGFEVVDDIERLTVLLIYKKESQEVPERVLKTARERMARYKEQS